MNYFFVYYKKERVNERVSKREREKGIRVEIAKERITRNLSDTRRVIVTNKRETQRGRNDDDDDDNDKKRITERKLFHLK